MNNISLWCIIIMQQTGSLNSLDHGRYQVVILEGVFLNTFYGLSSSVLLVNLLSGDCHRTLLMISQHCLYNGLVLSGNTTLPEPLLTWIYVAIWYDIARPHWVNCNILQNNSHYRYNTRNLLWNFRHIIANSNITRATLNVEIPLAA